MDQYSIFVYSAFVISAIGLIGLFVFARKRHAQILDQIRLRSQGRTPS